MCSSDLEGQEGALPVPESKATKFKVISRFGFMPVWFDLRSVVLTAVQIPPLLQPDD